jgi:hypothetical protein
MFSEKANTNDQKGKETKAGAHRKKTKPTIGGV